MPKAFARRCRRCPATPTTRRSRSATRSTWSRSSARAPSCAAPASNAYFGPLPVPRRAHRLLPRRPGGEALPLLRLQVSGDPFRFVHGDGGPRLRRRDGVAGRALRGRRWRSPTRIRGAAERRARARAAARAARARRRATTRATCGRRGEAAPARELPRRARPGARRRCASSASATRPSAWDQLLLASRAGRLHRATSCSRPGWRSARKQQRAGSTTASAGGSCSRCADARGRVLGFGARAMRDDQQPKYLNTSEGEVFHKGRQLFGADLARAPPRAPGA